jgi:hypothetical protein
MITKVKNVKSNNKKEVKNKYKYTNSCDIIGFIPTPLSHEILIGSKRFHVLG